MEKTMSATPSDRIWSTEDVPLDRPNVARMYDYYLGGYHNFAIDRQAAERAIAIYPDLPLVMQANRAFLRRAVSFLAHAGIDQFLDIGSGIPTVGSVHEVAQQINPAARVVYVDIDPIAVAHSEAILEGNPHATSIRADARQPDKILAHPALSALLDLRRPVGILMVALLHFVTDDATAIHLVRRLVDGVGSGSFLVLSHATRDTEAVPPEVREQMQRLYGGTSSPLIDRPHDKIAQFFDGLELIQPGVVYVPLWRLEGPDEVFLDQPARSISSGAVGRKA